MTDEPYSSFGTTEKGSLTSRLSPQDPKVCEHEKAVTVAAPRRSTTLALEQLRV